MFDSLEVRHDLSHWILILLDFVGTQEETVDPYQLNTLVRLQTWVVVAFFTALLTGIQQPFSIAIIESESIAILELSDGSAGHFLNSDIAKNHFDRIKSFLVVDKHSANFLIYTILLRLYPSMRLLGEGGGGRLSEFHACL